MEWEKPSGCSREPRMLVLHGSEHLGRLALWGETPPGDSPSRRGRRKKPDHPASPLDPGGEGLFEAIAEALPDNQDDWGDALTMTAWLPSLPDRPLASSPL